MGEHESRRVEGAEEDPAVARPDEGHERADPVRDRDRPPVPALGVGPAGPERPAREHPGRPAGEQLGGAALEREVIEERERMLGFAEGVRSGRIRGSEGARFERIVNIGIGGADLGPAVAGEALKPVWLAGRGVRCTATLQGRGRVRFWAGSRGGVSTSR